MSAVRPLSPESQSWRREVLLPARADVAAAGLLAALVAVLYWRVVFTGEVFFGRDVAVFFHSQAEAFFSAVRSGSWPLWNPWAGFGEPMLANANTQTLYPLTWLLLLVPTGAFHGAHALLHLWWAGLGVYFLSRHLGTSCAGALSAGAAFLLSGPLLSLLEVLHLAGASWLPWVVLAAARALESGRRADGVLWGLAASAQVLAGSPDMCALATAATAAWWIARLRSDVATGAARRGLAAAAAAAAVALGLGAAPWLPTAAAALHGARGGLAFEVRAFWSLHPLTVPQLLLPVSLAELPRHSARGAALYDVWDPFLRSLYLGAAFLGLAAAAFVPASRSWRLPIACVGTSAFLVALGRHTPVYAALAAAVPGVSLFRFPAKAMVLGAWAWALLVGFGFDVWRSAASQSLARWRRLVIVPVAAIAAVALAGAVALSLAAGPVGGTFLTPVAGGLSFREILAPASRSLAVTAVVSLLVLAAAWRPARTPSWALPVAAIAILDLLRAHAGLNATARPDFYRYRPPILDVIAPANGRPRVFVWDYVLGAAGSAHEGMLANFIPAAPGREAAVRLGLAMQEYLYPPAYVRWGLYGSFDRDLLGFQARETSDLATAVRALEGTPSYSRLLRVGAVDDVVALHEQGHEGLIPTTVQGLLRLPIRVFRVPHTQPRTYLVGAAVRADGEDAFRTLVATDFDPARQVVLPAAGGAAAQPEPPGFAGHLTIEEERADRMRVRAELSHPGWLVRVASYDRGWRARLDGTPADLLRANLAFQALPVPAGRHTIELRYLPASVVWGGAVSLVTALALAGVAAAALVRRRRA